MAAKGKDRIACRIMYKIELFLFLFFLLCTDTLITSHSNDFLGMSNLPEVLVLTSITLMLSANRCGISRTT